MKREIPGTVLAALVMLSAALVYNVWYMTTITSKYQPVHYVRQEYKDCKAQAPEGFDCVMSPLLVSEQYIKETYGDKR